MKKRNLDDINVMTRSGNMFCLTDLPENKREEHVKDIDNIKTLQYMVLNLAHRLRECGDTFDIVAEYENGDYELMMKNK